MRTRPQHSRPLPERWPRVLEWAAHAAALNRVAQKNREARRASRQKKKPASYMHRGPARPLAPLPPVTIKPARLEGHDRQPRQGIRSAQQTNETVRAWHCSDGNLGQRPRRGASCKDRPACTLATCPDHKNARARLRSVASSEASVRDQVDGRDSVRNFGCTAHAHDGAKRKGPAGASEAVERQ